MEPGLDVPLNPKEGRCWVDRTFSALSPGSVRGSIFTVCTITVGPSLLMPYSFSHTGICLGLLLILLGAFTFKFYYSVMVKAFDCSLEYTYVGAMEFFYGSCMRRLVELSIIMLLFGVMCAYEAVVVENTLGLLSEFNLVVQESQGVRIAVNAFLVVAVLAPLSLGEQLSRFRYSNAICITCVVYILAMITTEAPFYISENFNYSELKLVNLDDQVATVFSIMLFSFGFSAAVPVVYAELTQRSYRRMSKVIDRSILFAALLYSLIGILGYLSYMGNVPEQVTLRGSLHPVNHLSIVISKVLVIVSLSQVLILCVVPLRLSIEQMICGVNFSYSCCRFYWVTFGIQVSIFCVCIVFPNSISYFKLLGGLFSIPTSILFPALMHWKVEKSYYKRLGCLAWSALLSFVGIMASLKTTSK